MQIEVYEVNESCLRGEVAIGHQLLPCAVLKARNYKGKSLRGHTVQVKPQIKQCGRQTVATAVTSWVHTAVCCLPDSERQVSLQPFPQPYTMFRKLTSPPHASTPEMGSLFHAMFSI